MSLRLIETLTQIRINFIVSLYVGVRSPFCGSHRKPGTKGI